MPFFSLSRASRLYFIISQTFFFNSVSLIYHLNFHFSRLFPASLPRYPAATSIYLFPLFPLFLFFTVLLSSSSSHLSRKVLKTSLPPFLRFAPFPCLSAPSLPRCASAYLSHTSYSFFLHLIFLIPFTVSSLQHTLLPQFSLSRPTKPSVFSPAVIIIITSAPVPRLLAKHLVDPRQEEIETCRQSLPQLLLLGPFFHTPSLPLPLSCLVFHAHLLVV